MLTVASGLRKGTTPFLVMPCNGMHSPGITNECAIPGTPRAKQWENNSSSLDNLGGS